MSVKKGNKAHKSRCETYRKLGKREANKQRKLIRHMKKHPNDLQAKRAM